MRSKDERLVGRARELANLNRVLDETCAGAASLVFLTGQPGIGKTHVLSALVRQAERRGCLVLEGNAAEFEQELPFGVVIDALDAFVESLDRQIVDRLAADGLQELSNVFPSLRSLRSTTTAPSTATERFRSYYAVRELIERLASQQPLVLVLDDLHWADGASIELVAHLIRRPPDAPILLAGSFRTGQADPALTAAVEAAGRSGALTCIDLGPLAPEEASELLPAADASRRANLYRQSGGNPFYLLQLAKVEGLGQARTRTDDPQVPAAVVAAIAHELAKLSQPARAFVEAAAVVGDPFELDLAAVSAAVPEAEAMAALDELIACDLVHPAQVPRRFSFRHPLVRGAVYEAAPTSVRLAAHARCGAALADQGAPAPSLAHHIEQSARHGDEAAVATLVEAGTQTAHRLPSSAARWFRAALRLLPESAPLEERFDLVMATAGAFTAAGRLVDARAVLLEAFARLPRECTEIRVRVTAACAGIEQQIGCLDDAHARLVTALDELTDRRSEAGVSLMVALATDGLYRMEYAAMEEWGREAVTVAEGVGNLSLLAAAEAVLTMACAFMGHTAEAELHRVAAAALVDAMADEELAVRLDAIGHLAGAELYLERFEETTIHARRGIMVARAAGRDDVFPTLNPCLGTSTWVVGRLDESAQVLDGAVEAARLAGNDQSLGWSLLNRALGALMAGDVALALRTSEESVDLVGSAGDTFVSSLAVTIHAWMLYEHGEAARAADMLIAACGGEELPLVPGGWRATYLEVLVHCFLDLGRVGDARLAADRALALALRVDLPRTTAVARRARGTVAMHEGDAHGAVKLAEAAVEAAERCSARLDAALSRILLGQALARAGDEGRAVVELVRAATDLDAYGSIRYRDRAERELRRLGHRIHRRSQGGTTEVGMGALSGRELEVARLVVDRRTNPEIAASLFLSLKTVETHMRNIFRKLGVSSRVEVARLVERAAPMS